MSVPSVIERVGIAVSARDDTHSENYSSLKATVYNKVILNNVNVDPACRMKPQDIFREMIILNSKCK